MAVAFRTETMQGACFTSLAFDFGGMHAEL